MTALYATLIWFLTLFGLGEALCPALTSSPVCEDAAARADADKDAAPPAPPPSGAFGAGPTGDEPISNGF